MKGNASLNQTIVIIMTTYKNFKEKLCYEKRSMRIKWFDSKLLKNLRKHEPFVMGSLYNLRQLCDFMTLEQRDSQEFDQTELHLMGRL